MAGTVTFTSSGAGGTTWIQPNGSTTTYSVTRSGNFPSVPYYIDTAKIEFTIQNVNEYGTLYIVGNGSTDLGNKAFSGNGNQTINLTTTYNYAGLNQITIKRGSTGSGVAIYNGNPRLTVTVTWKESYTKCTAPTTLSVSSTLTGAGTVTLSWSGAAGGTVNDITGYGIQKQDSADGTTWGEWTDLTTVSTAETYGSESVAINPNPGQYRCYRVITQGAAGATYYSDASVASAAVQRYGKAKAPNSVIASTYTPGVGEQVTLSWTGAAAGVGDTIDGYDVLQAQTLDGPWHSVAGSVTTATSGSTVVFAPSTFGGAYYFKVVTLSATNTTYDSAMSTAYALIVAGYGLCTAPTSITATPPASYPQGMVQISWAGAQGGYLNPVAGYEIARASTPDGVYGAIGNTTEEYFVTPAPEVIGTNYYYKVRAIGMINGYDSDYSNVYATVYASAIVPVTGSIGRTNAEV